MTKRRTNVAVVSLKALQPGDLFRTSPLIRGALRQPCEIVGVQTTQATTLVLASQPGQLLQGIFMDDLELGQQFARCGYELGNPGSPPSGQYLIVRDPGTRPFSDPGSRIAMAIVYPDAAAAIAAHERAHRQAEERLGESRPFSDDQGPQLPAGYGGSVWRANVAMVQTTGATLASLWTVDAQTDEARIARPDLFELGFPSNLSQYAIDRDFVACLEDAALTAQPTPAAPAAVQTHVAPNFLAAWQW